ncbi:hypothetical protein [Gandjariella thermophila]|uniref:Uncharacterized protein n=1 Tax=Gandjariella thermophila TaxID=1931992 RepID=A0A4D4JCK1_9PSEU|nr:hypothetical protein [Gandjariella thermophila]GDY33344.1 hypothetical protein GTS_49770 [Gandjariella thermophila]
MDLGTGLPLHNNMLGPLATLQVHHIFPKAVLNAHGYGRGEVNAVANFCFLTQNTNLAIGKKNPQDYLAEVQAKYPGALESQWIPTDPDLWTPERYPDFLAARRRLLADAANIDQLVEWGCVEPLIDSEIADPETGAVLAVAEAFWPDGLQPGQGAPVVLELDEDAANLARLEELGFEVYTSVSALRGRVRRRNEEAALVTVPDA